LTDLDYTGEFFVPGLAPKWIERHHVERYRFAACLSKGKTVLDIACGTGYGSRMLIAAGAKRVDGVDISGELIEFAREIHSCKGLAFMRGDIADFRSDIQYDVITCFETIEHVPDYRAAMGNLFMLQNRGGMLIISSPNRLIVSPSAKNLSDKPENQFHVREFTIEELRYELATAGYRVSDSDIYGQIQQRYFGSEFLNRAYRRVIRPHRTKSPKVTRVRSLMPRYFLITAWKRDH